MITLAMIMGMLPVAYSFTDCLVASVLVRLERRAPAGVVEGDLDHQVVCDPLQGSGKFVRVEGVASAVARRM